MTFEMQPEHRLAETPPEGTRVMARPLTTVALEIPGQPPLILDEETARQLYEQLHDVLGSIARTRTILAEYASDPVVGGPIPPPVS